MPISSAQLRAPLRVILPCLLLIVSLLAGCAQTAREPLGPPSTATATLAIPTATPVPTRPATITLGNSSGAAIPVDFAGFSIEPNYLCQFLDAEQRDPSLDQMYRAMGPTVLRLGGNTMDTAIWQPNAPCSQLTFGVETVIDFFAFAQRVDAQVIWGLNLKANDPGTAADEASVVAAIGGDRLLGFELGNEPNGWTSESQYIRMWDAYASAITSVVPDARFTGPGMNDGEGNNWFYQFVAHRHAHLAAVTYHYYPLQSTAGPKTATTPSVANLLSPQLMARAAANVKRVVRQAATYRLPLRIEETNSVNGGGAVGISNVFAAALWSADYLFTAAEQGAAGLYFHSNGGILSGDPYAPIALNAETNTFYARPLYFGMLLFHLATRGGAAAVPATVSSPVNVTAHAVVDSEGQLQVVLINKDQTYGAMAHVELGGYGNVYRQARAVRLIGPSLAATSGITLGGATVDDNGNWSPSGSEHVGVKNAGFTVMVPPGSAVIVALTA